MTFNENQQISLHIEDLTSKGEGVATYDGLKVFVDGGLIGEEIVVRITRKRNNYAVGRLEKVVKKAPFRVVPKCPYYDRCGGCQIMHMSETAQLSYKQSKVQSAMKRIAKSEVVVEKVLSPTRMIGYRNKIQAPMMWQKKEKRIGFYQKGSHEIVDIEHCLLHNELGNRIYQYIREELVRWEITLYDEKSSKGDLRHLLLRSFEDEGQVLVGLVGMRKPTKEVCAFAEKLGSACDEVKGVIYCENQGRSNVVSYERSSVLYGEDKLGIRFMGFDLELSLGAFFQVNRSQAEVLYSVAIEMAELNSNDVVLDAYCGIGLLSLIMAQRQIKTVAIEVVPSAICDAKKNLINNGLGGVEFICGRIEDHLDKISGCNVAFINPPRKGCDRSLLEAFGNGAIKKIIYTSCDPATMARDCNILTNEFGYRIRKVQPVDMFVQTVHIESVVLLECI